MATASPIGAPGSPPGDTPPPARASRRISLFTSATNNCSPPGDTTPPARASRRISLFGSSTNNCRNSKSRRKVGKAGQVRKRRVLAVSALARSKEAAYLFKLRTQGVELNRKQRIFLLLNEPSSSPEASHFAALMWVLVLLSAACSALETVPSITYHTGPGIWLAAKYAYNLFFTAEAVVRINTYQGTTRRVYHDVFIWLDLVAVVPFWLRIFFYPSTMATDEFLNTQNRALSIRFLESLGSARLLKLCRYFEGSALLIRAVARSMSQLSVPLFMLFIMIYVFSSILYEIEFNTDLERCNERWRAQGVDEKFLIDYPDGVSWGCDVCAAEQSNSSDVDLWVVRNMCVTCGGFPSGHPECATLRFAQIFRSVPGTMWFMIATVTTVGYGDLSPNTWRGQIFAGLVILCGVIFLAMPLSTVGNVFTLVWDERQLAKLQAHLRQMLSENGISPTDVVQVPRASRWQ